MPKIPNKDKDKMPIYLLFVQHILYSLKDNGKAAIVVPTGFITAQSGIEKSIRKEIIDKGWLKGVISMPSNIFATTGTNVSILFIDKGKKSDLVILIDSSKIGTKIKDGKNQRTVLNHNDIEKIEDTFIKCLELEDFSVIVDYEKIKDKNYSLSAGQYFEIKIPFSNITPEEFEKNKNKSIEEIKNILLTNENLGKEIIKDLEKIKYGI